MSTTVASNKPKARKVRKVHLTAEQIQAKILRLEEKAGQLVGAENKKRRMNCFQQLAKLKKAG